MEMIKLLVIWETSSSTFYMNIFNKQLLDSMDNVSSAYID